MTGDPLLDDEGPGGLGGSEKETCAHSPYKESGNDGRPALQQCRPSHPEEQQYNHPPGPKTRGNQVGRYAEDKVGYKDGGAEQSLCKWRKVHLLGDFRQKDADDEDDAEGGAYTGG